MMQRMNRARLNRKTMVPIVSNPAKRNGTVGFVVSNESVDRTVESLPLYNTEAIPPSSLD